MKKKHPEHVNLERWLVSYADFITLLFAFFVVMYAISQADLAKFKTVSLSLKKAFTSPGPVGMVDLGGNAGGNTANILDERPIVGGRLLNMPAGKTHTQADPDEELHTLKEMLEESITLELGLTDLSEAMEMVFDSQGLVLRLAAKNFFDAGKIDVEPDLRPLLDRIGRVLSKTQRIVRIEGHSDPSEDKGGSYPSGWELSAARAGWVAKYWLDRFQMEPRRVGISGYSHFRPLSENSTEWGKASNRRVEIIVLNSWYRVE